jgi:CRP-like cAMP-binding protein
VLSEVDFLAEVSIFALMERKDLESIAKMIRRYSFHEGDVIIREGDQDRRLFILVSGEVKVVKNLGTQKEQRVANLEPYNYFGEMALIDDMARSASVVARMPTEVLSLNHWNLRREIEKYPALAFELLKMLSQRIRGMQKTMINTLGALLPICSGCRKIRNTTGSWIQIDTYIQDHSETEFTHSICPQCLESLYPSYAKIILAD